MGEETKDAKIICALCIQISFNTYFPIERSHILYIANAVAYSYTHHRICY